MIAWRGQKLERRLAIITIGLVSFATILFELLQTRVLSFIFWNHLVYITLSSAMLGFGISGTITSIFMPKITDSGKLLSKLLALFGATASGALYLTYLLPLLGGQSGLIKIFAAYFIYLFPFVFAGSIISVLLSSPNNNVGRLYAADLLSAGLACIAFFFLLPLLEPDKLIGLITLVMGALAMRWASEDKALKLTGFAVASVGLMVVICSIFVKIPLLAEPYKELHDYLSVSGAAIETTVWTPLCRIDVTNISPGVKEITQDASAHTYLLSAKNIEEINNSAKNNTDMYPGTMAWDVKQSPDVAVIGVGGGIDIANALAHGSKSVISAELNPATYDIVTRRYADYNGHFTTDKRLTPLVEEGRNMLRQQNKKFDIIQVIGIDTFAALSSGAYVLSENYLYTTEAFREMFNHLHEDGILSFGRWSTFPPKESLRLVSIALEAMRLNGGHELDKRVFIFYTANGWAVCLFKNSPFTIDEFQTIKAGAARRKLPVIYWPKVLPAKQQADLEKAYYQNQDKQCVDSHSIFQTMIEAFEHNTEKQFFDSYPALVTPTTDDSPFFFEYSKSALELPNFNDLRGSAANVTLYAVLSESILFTLMAIFFPLWKFQRQSLDKSMGIFSVYFAAIGTGFMLVEIALMQKCVLFLGSPLYSLPVVLASLLLSAGVGSWLVTRLNWSIKKTVTTFGSALVLLLILLGVGVNAVFYALMHAPLLGRILVTSALLFPLGILMGTFLPVGLQRVREKRADYVPWVWGINGCASVLGSFAAILIAISSGFTIVFICGAALYAVAVVSGLKFAKDEETVAL
ncbi:MAG TPA: hypothetical protein V6C81_23685 [Planktothrix sp.]|jgi:hypothetical protein